MTTLSPQQALLIQEIKRLNQLGVALVPLGGDNGKQALVKFKDQEGFPAGALTDLVKAGKATGIGFRLHSCVVVDIDSDDPAWITKCEDRFGKSEVRVRTPSGGIHLYYAGSLKPQPKLKAEGWPVDIKQGANQYVVAAYSWRPDGKAYCVEGSEFIRSKLTEIRGAATDAVERDTAGKVAKGNRHAYLLEKGKEFARSAQTLDQLTTAITKEFEANCVQDDLNTDEITGIANWCWEAQNNGTNYAAGQKTLTIPGWSIDRLAGDPFAQHLLIFLLDAHKGAKGRRFILDYECMKNSPRLNLSRDRFRQARNLLLSVGVIRCVCAPARFKHKAQYELCV
jgi:hypothetical protein